MTIQASLIAIICIIVIFGESDSNTTIFVVISKIAVLTVTEINTAPSLYKLLIFLENLFTCFE